MDKYILIPSLKKLKKEVLTSKRALFKALLDEADRTLLIPLYKQPPQESTTYLSQAIMNLTLAYKLSDDKKYLSEAINFIDTVCSYPYWGNAHLVNVDLSASWIMFGLSLAYHYLQDDLNEEEKLKIENKLLLQAKIMFDYINEHEDSWPKHYFQNHNWINFTGLSMVGYALEHKYEEVIKYKEIAKKNFEIVFSYLPEDGSDYEGVTYWRYGVLWLYIYASILKDRENIDYFKTCKFLKNTMYYRLYQSASKINNQLNFGDCHDRYSASSIAIFYKFASLYQDGYAQKYANEIFKHHYYEEQYLSKIKPGITKEIWLALLYYDEKVQEKDLSTLDKVSYFKDLGLITIRTGFSENDYVFSIKCSYPGGKKQFLIGSDYYKKNKKWIMSLSHHHPDNLSYILTHNDDYLVIDDSYNRNILPYDHNVLLVDDIYSDVSDVNDVYLDSIKKRIADNPNYDISNYYGNITYFFTNQELTFFKMDNTNIYPLHLKMKEVSRFVITNNLKYIIFIDKFISDEEHYYQSVINLDHPIIKLQDKYKLSMFDDMTYKLISQDDLKLHEIKSEIKSVMTTQEPNNYARIIMYHNVVSTTKRMKKHQRIEFFTPEDYVLKMYDNYIQINNDEYLLFHNDLNFSFDGEYLYIKLKNNFIEEITLINGNKVIYKDKEIIKLAEKGSISKGGLHEIFK